MCHMIFIQFSGFLGFPGFPDPETGFPEKCTPGSDPGVKPDPTVPHMLVQVPLVARFDITLVKCNIDVTPRIHCASKKNVTFYHYLLNKIKFFACMGHF